MGCSSGRAIQEEEGLLNSLEKQLKDFERLLVDFEKENFTTTEEMNKLPIKEQIDQMQVSINDNLREARKSIKDLTDDNPTKQNKENKLNEITSKSEELYAKNSNIIKEKIKNELNE